MSQLEAVSTVADARANLSTTLRRFRHDVSAQPLILGSHRRAEAALIPIAMYERLAAGATATVEPSILNQLRARRKLIERLARLSNIRSVSVFGSVARETETATSDIDLLVEPNDQAGLFDLAQFTTDMEQLVGRSVDVVSRRSLRGEEDTAILDDAVSL